MPGIEKLIRGMVKYHATMKNDMLKQFRMVKDNPQPKAVMFSCMDSRVMVTRMLQADVGDVFLVRNAGNLIPNKDSVGCDTITTEPVALEFGCILNDIRHILVCGHSDCKAMNTLYGLRDAVQIQEGLQLQTWLKRHGTRTVAKYNELLDVGGIGPVMFQGEVPSTTFAAYIDAENKFDPADKLSQVNTLTQLQNIASYPFLRDKLESNKVHLHALWFDVNDGDFYMFSRSQERFLHVAEEHCERLIADSEGPKL